MFGIIDALLPNFQSLQKVRGSVARRLFGFDNATGLRLAKGVDFGQGFEQIDIGGDCFIGPGCVFYTSAPAKIKIGSRVWIAAESLVWSGSHKIGDESQRCGDGTFNSIEIGNGTWIGLRCTILNSVGTGSVVGASTTVVKEMPSNSVIYGIPGEVRRTLPVDAANETFESDNS